MVCDADASIFFLYTTGPKNTEFDWTRGWYAEPRATQTLAGDTYPVIFQRPDLSKAKHESRKYRNPVIYARELHNEMVRDNLTRKQRARRHGVSSDRITQWLCLLRLPQKKQRKIESLGDYWTKPIITERKLRQLRQSGSI